jgi:hypothetical protein
MQPRLFPPSLLALCLALAACTSAPPTSEQYFADAKSNVATLDFESALKNLDRLIKAAGNQPISQQGIVLRTALLAGMADAAKQMAEAYAAGAKQPPAQARHAQFGQMRSDYYGISRVRLINAMEAVMQQRGKLGNQPLRLDMAFPEFTGTENPAVTKVKEGQWVEEAERYRAELESVRNALARALARLAGAGEDVHKGQAAFGKGGVEIDPRVYLIELSGSFTKLSEIFDKNALNDVRYRRIALEVARDNMDLALKLLSAKPDKDLEARAKKIRAECEKGLKKLVE